MHIKTLVVTPFQQNARLITDESETSAVIIDPGGEVDRIYSSWGLDKLSNLSVFLTHSHIDHIGGLGALISKLESEQKDLQNYWGHELEQEWRQSVRAQAQHFGLPAADYEDVPEPFEYLQGEERVDILGREASVLYTPGHSPGHLSLYFEAQPWREEWLYPDGESESFEGEGPVLIAGDALFKGSIGRTDLPGGDMDTLLNSIREKLFCLPEETVVLSGHGPNTTIAAERDYNPFLQEMS